MAVDADARTFEEEVLHSDVPVLADFWGPRCVPCLTMMPKVAELADRYRARLKLVKIDASHNRRLCLDMRVFGLPTYILYKDGMEIDRLSGEGVTIEDIDRSVRKLFD